MNMNSIALPIEEVQKISLDTLLFLVNICDKEQLQYFITYGTLLGSIRHHGFIPWDDDVDIMMPRPDYDKLCDHLISHSENYQPYKLFNMKTVQDYPYMISRFCDTRYRIETHNENDVGMGCFVDIYPLDGIGTDYAEACKFMRRVRKYPRLIFLSTRINFEFGQTKGFDKVLKFLAYLLAKLLGKKLLVSRLNSLNSMCLYESSKYVGVTLWGRSSRYFIFEKNKTQDLILGDFEGHSLSVPRDYDYFLSAWYGNYMSLPPLEKRIYRHEYRVYRK